MNNEESKEFASIFFTSLNFTVTPIPTAAKEGERRADLYAERDGDSFVIEAKAKAEDVKFIDHIKKVFEKGSNELVRETQPWNALSSKIKKAAKQLEETPAPNHAVRLIWASCLHPDWKFVLEAIQHRLLGDVMLARFKKTSGLPEMLSPQTCFYYFPADFIRYRVIDGAILAGPKGVRLLINEFGTRVVQLRNTYLYQQMSNKNVVTDPTILEENGAAMAIREQLPSGDSEARRQYCISRYGVMTSIAQGYNFRADVAIPAEELARSRSTKSE